MISSSPHPLSPGLRQPGAGPRGSDLARAEEVNIHAPTSPEIGKNVSSARRGADQPTPTRATGCNRLTDNDLGGRALRGRNRGGRCRRRLETRGILTAVVVQATGLCLGSLAGAIPLAAQLRPLEPVPWEVFAPGAVTVAQLGVSVFSGQRASLAGTEGRLLELGSYAAAWRTGRVALELGGSVLRVFDDRVRWAEPAGGAALRFGRRVDAGELRVGTSVRLTPERWPGAAVLRFGARLPTASHVTGIEREETDFLGTLALAWRRARLEASAEAGIGILGTRVPGFTQEDDLVYAAHVAYRLGALRPDATFTGQSSPLRYRRPRGVEDLRELRLGIRAGRARWLDAHWVVGLVPFSPRSGLLLSAGMSLPRR